MNELFGYSLFTEVNEPLRSYNRCVTIMNMVEGGYREQAEEYFSQFNKSESALIMAVALGIKKDGLEETKRKVISNINWDEMDAAV